MALQKTLIALLLILVASTASVTPAAARSNGDDVPKKTKGNIVPMVSGRANSWCVATIGASQSALVDNINFACTHGVDCSPIQQGGFCYEPNTLNNHASFVMNSYYQINGRHEWDCDFKGTATIAVTDPSFGTCKYLSVGQ